MKFPLYNLWMDNMFYVYLGALAASLFGLFYSARALLRPARPENREPFPAQPVTEEAPEPVELIEELPLPAADPGEKTVVVENMAELAAAQAAAEAPAAPEPAADPEKTVVVGNVEELVAAAQAGPDIGELIAQAEAEAALPAEPAPAPAEEPGPGSPAPSSPEELVRGIYSRISGMDARVQAIEEHLKTGGGRHFAAKFLEGVLEDFDTLSEPKIKARLQYLLSDLREARARGDGQAR